MAGLNDKPAYCYESGCPLAHKATGFVLGCGDPETAKLAILLEAAGGEEILFRLAPEKGRRFYETQEQCDAEISTRRRDYPSLPESFLRRGVPVCGRSGFEIAQWLLPAVGITRAELFIDNGLRCKPPKQGDSNYPLGDERKKAEACCRHYDRWDKFSPQISVISIHPAAVVRDPVVLWLQVKGLEKARDFVRQGLKTLYLAGGKAVKWWLGYGETVTKWMGHYEFNDAAAEARRAERLERYGNVTVGEKREKKDDKESHQHSGRKRGRRTDVVEALFSGL